MAKREGWRLEIGSSWGGWSKVLRGTFGVAVAAWACVDGAVCAFGGGEAGEDAVVEIDEGAKEQRGAGPEGAEFILECQMAFHVAISYESREKASKVRSLLLSKVNRNALCHHLKTPPDPSYSFSKSSTNFSLGCPSHRLVQQVKRIQPTRRNDRLLHATPLGMRYEFLKFPYAYVLNINGPLLRQREAAGDGPSSKIVCPV